MHNPRRVTTAELRERADKYIHQNVETTDGRSGLVTDALLAPGGRIVLKVESIDGEAFETDNEHATIAR